MWHEVGGRLIGGAGNHLRSNQFWLSHLKWDFWPSDILTSKINQMRVGVEVQLGD